MSKSALLELDGPRRRIVFLAKMEADDWDTLADQLDHLAREISRHGKLSATSISGGYSCGHIIVTSEDGSIDHDKWAAELNAHLQKIAAEESARANQEKTDAR